MPLPSNSASVPGVRVVYHPDGVEREDAGTPGAHPLEAWCAPIRRKSGSVSAWTRWDTGARER
jgi:hypothetical protein